MDKENTNSNISVCINLNFYIIITCLCVGFMIGSRFGQKTIREIIGPTKTYKVEGLVSWWQCGIGTDFTVVNPLTKKESEKFIACRPAVYRDGKKYVIYRANNLWTKSLEIHTD